MEETYLYWQEQTSNSPAHVLECKTLAWYLLQESKGLSWCPLYHNKEADPCHLFYSSLSFSSLCLLQLLFLSLFFTSPTSFLNKGNGFFSTVHAVCIYVYIYIKRACTWQLKSQKKAARAFIHRLPKSTGKMKVTYSCAFNDISLEIRTLLLQSSTIALHDARLHCALSNHSHQIRYIAFHEVVKVKKLFWFIDNMNSNRSCPGVMGVWILRW